MGQTQHLSRLKSGPVSTFSFSNAILVPISKFLFWKSEIKAAYEVIRAVAASSNCILCKPFFFFFVIWCVWNKNVMFQCMKRSNVVEQFCGHTTENASRLGYEHVCGNYLHMASHDYQEVIQHTHTHPHTHSLTESFYFFSLNSHLSFNTNSSGEWKFQILNQKHMSQACHIHKQTKEGVRRHKGSKSQYS